MTINSEFQFIEDDDRLTPQQFEEKQKQERKDFYAERKKTLYPNAPRSINPREVSQLLCYVLDGLSNKEALHQLALTINPEDEKLKGMSPTDWVQRVYTNTFYRMAEVLPPKDRNTEYIDKDLDIPMNPVHPLADELEIMGLWLSNESKYLRTIMNDLRKKLELKNRLQEGEAAIARVAELEAENARLKAEKAVSPEATPAAVKRAGWKAEATELLKRGKSVKEVSEAVGKHRNSITPLVKLLREQGLL